MTDKGGAPRTDHVVVMNRDSGDDGAPDAETVAAAFAGKGLSATVLTVSAAEDMATRISDAVRSGAECVVAAGGDGTICAVAEAVKDRDIDLGVIPLGTFNYFARRFGIPQDVGSAVEVIGQGRTHPIALGAINERTFINNASLGLYTSILEQRESIYSRWGRSRLAAYWSVLVAMATVYRPMTMRITVDGVVRRARTPMVFVALSAFQLEKFGIEGAEAIREGRFAVLLAPDCGRFRLIWKALQIAVRGARSGRDFTLLTGERVIVETRGASQVVARDGERERMTSPFTLEIERDAVRLRVSGDANRRGDAR